MTPEQPSAVERLAALHPDTEIWWDSSPLIYARWARETLAAGDVAVRPAAVRGVWDPQPTAHGATPRAWRGILRGSTTNPPLAWEAIEADRPRWDALACSAAAETRDPQETMWRVYGEVAHSGAALLEPLYRASDGRYGHICAQVDPRYLHDLDAMLAQARRLRALAPNIMVKMPATAEGIEGIRVLSAEGVPTTATLCFSVAQLVAVAEAAQAGYAERRARGLSMAGVRCCAALMLGRLEDAPPFREQAAEAGVTLSEEDVRWAGVAVARRAHAIYRERAYDARLLCASMRLGPTREGQARIWHLEQLAGGEIVFTIFPNILASFLHLYDGRPLEPRVEEPVPADVLERLLRVPYFRQAYEEDGVTPEGFADLPGVRLTGRAFADAMEKIAAYAEGIVAATAS